MIGGNTASTTADQIVGSFLKSKDRKFNTKQDDRKSSRMVMIGLCPKGTDGQMYTSSSKIYTYF